MVIAAVMAGISATVSQATTGAAAPRPAIVWKPIPFSAVRRGEMAAYALRHYGLNTWHMQGPHVIVEHYTANQSFSATWNTFASDTPDPELHELPGDCAHFVIDTDGTIYQLVPLNTMCRHTVGLNYTAIGIEHVGDSDSQILHDPTPATSIARAHPLADAALPHHTRKRDRPQRITQQPLPPRANPSWRCQTHGDWTRADMTIYRNDLRTLARRYRRSRSGPNRRLRATGC